MGSDDLRLQPGESAWHQLPAEEVARRLQTDLRQGPVSYTHLTLPTNREV